MHADSIQLLSSCTCSLPQIFASNMLSQSDKPLGHLYRPSAVDCQKLSVATKFKVKCMDYLSRTEGATGTKSRETRIWAVPIVYPDLNPNH